MGNIGKKRKRNGAIQLRVCYDFGKGVKRDIVKAVKYYEVAASQKFVAAQYSLADCYLKGDGVKKDKILAMAWFLCALNGGDARANNMVSGLLKELPENDIKEAVNLACKFLGANK